ncbi:UvrB/UvrC motif-containing protein [Clostridium sp. Marseille-P299]|uniref:UvrB/UvrC motif-containing protein n=1 Tax=Clostridium sp. Marseille-P299 TaxID=1805477 RepID=UPI000829DB50|nr:UvrB/UvrC motif-containing protein [Clostridium sp. Marseille-P299]
MLCDVCNKREAKIYYTEIVNGKKKEQHLCEECAAEHTSFKIKNPITNQEFTIGGLLSGILESYSTSDNKEESSSEVTCIKCGLKYSEFLNHGKFGCAGCYHSFGKMLPKSFRSIHGAELHTGKRPKGYISETNRIVNSLSEYEKLSIQLQRAIEQEEFEEAAKIRDAMKAIKNNEVEPSNHEHQGC